MWLNVKLTLNENLDEIFTTKYVQQDQQKYTSKQANKQTITLNFCFGRVDRLTINQTATVLTVMSYTCIQQTWLA